MDAFPYAKLRRDREFKVDNVFKLSVEYRFDEIFWCSRAVSVLVD